MDRKKMEEKSELFFLSLTDHHFNEFNMRWAYEKAYTEGYADAEQRVRVLEQELETERMRLAGCGVVAMQNTRESTKERITKDNPYWSASYGDVCSAVDREISLREALEQYGKHKSFCKNDTAKTYSKDSCTCGLEEALKAVEVKDETSKSLD